MSFKVGDWVTSKSWADTDRSPAQITNIELATTPDEEDFVFLGDNYCIELEYIEKWVPKEGDWVIPDTGIDKDMFVVMRYNGVSLIPSRCRPFIGELPYEN